MNRIFLFTYKSFFSTAEQIIERNLLREEKKQNVQLLQRGFRSTPKRVEVKSLKEIWLGEAVL